MAHYAFIDENNIVVQVIVGRNEDEVVNGISDWENYYGELHGLRCLRTSYNSKAGKRWNMSALPPVVIDNNHFRFNFAGSGYAYDEERDAFIPPKPFASWILNEETCQWDAPKPYPGDEETFYIWNETKKDWVKPV